MISALQKRFALTRKGARDFLKGVFYTTLLDIAFMLTAVYLFTFLDNYLQLALAPAAGAPEAGAYGGAGYYIVLGLLFMAVMYSIAIYQYRSTYTTVYEESATRRTSLAEKLRKLPLAFFGEKNLSDLTSTIMDDSTQLEHTFSHAVPQLFASIISILLVAVGLFFYNWQLALALFWVVPVAAAIILASKKKQYRKFFSGYQTKREVSELIQEGLETVQEIKSYTREQEYLQGLDEVLDRYERQLVRGELLVGGLIHSSQGLLKLGLASVIVFGAGLLAEGSITLLTYLIYLMVSSRVYAPVNEVFNNLAALFYLDVRVERMKEMEKLPVQQGSADFNPERYDIVFEHVDFSYMGGSGVLHDVSFTAKQGEITALVGPSGGGKSTASKLAARFWDVDRGRILLGGKDISTADPEALLQYYSVVFQDVVLFNASVMENIRIGRRGASDEEVLHAARLAQCEDFVSRLPAGYHTVIGENGETLSGGERQRISIARALLKDAPVILLDEATASLDVENETKIQTAVSRLVQNKTVLIIAHRMRTVVHADNIVVLADGAVVEQGAPEELIKNNGVFARMLKRQMSAGSGETSN
jgi:ATP-binding cassette, subfamily B, bacterial IrtB/YbtQ